MSKPSSNDSRKYWYRTLKERAARQLREPYLFKRRRRKQRLFELFNDIFMNAINHRNWHATVASVYFTIAPFEEQIELYDYFLRLLHRYSLLVEHNILLLQFEMFLNGKENRPDSMESIRAIKRIRERYGMKKRSAIKTRQQLQDLYGYRETTVRAIHSLSTKKRVG